MKYLVGTRGSNLSLAQTNWVISELKKKNPNTEFEIKIIKTKGDTDTRPLFTINQKGIFEKEIDRAVSNKEIDFAVHSLKDIPSELPEGLMLGCIPLREAVNDVFISNDGSTLETIKPGAVIGTSSLRRAVQISRKRQDLTVKPVRGNIESRVRKVSEGIYDAIVLAQAGIDRLKLDVKFTKLSTNDFLPSPGQGALGIVAREDDAETIQILKTIEHKESRQAIESERAVSKHVESGCRFPVGAYSKADGQNLNLKVIAYSVDGKEMIIVEKAASILEPQILGNTVAAELKEKGIENLAANWREKVEEWNRK